MSYGIGHKITELQDKVITLVNNNITYLGVDAKRLGTEFFEKPRNLIDDIPFIFVDTEKVSITSSQLNSAGKVLSHTENHGIIVYVGSDRLKTADTDYGIDNMIDDVTTYVNGDTLNLDGVHGTDLKSCKQYAKFPIKSNKIEQIIIWRMVFDVELFRTD